MSGIEILSTVSGVTKLAGVVYMIFRDLYEVNDALSKAPSEIKDLALDLETFSEKLRLPSTLLEGRKNVANQVHPVTAKIIGDCATICVNIDRILRKLKNGKGWARVKWLYKEKEIMKLQGRLGDLKLSLMSTLSFINLLKADHLLHTVRGSHRSLIEDSKDERLSRNTTAQMQATKRALAQFSVLKAMMRERFGQRGEWRRPTM
ncbi:hypothetical protein G7Y89_g14413 [Cudoniella acicularis]|uniref:Fungal N-terminal domain-containing protein n=1 Tax=Cudoniella acicularis TaxID=354080 RepID=A0A8H4R2C4_9HELO|nr:hypothetical protein G7Y89_g14413 [Cudoniella acicularis]